MSIPNTATTQTGMRTNNMPDDGIMYDPHYAGDAYDRYEYDDDDDYEPFEDECKMCGKERPLNEQGYCSQCWVIWNS